MKNRILQWLCCGLFLVILPTTVLGLDKPRLEFEKVTGNVYLGKQSVPLYPILSDEKGPYLTVNFFVVANEEKSELVLIDMPVLIPDPKGGPPIADLLTPFLAILNCDFPGATIKAVLLTHDHMDHVSGSIEYFVTSGIPVYASALDVTTEPPGAYDFDTMTGIPLKLFVKGIGPGFQLSFDGGMFTAVDLKGHTPGQLGYALSDDDGRINRLFAGDALLAPEQDYGGKEDKLDITFLFRLQILIKDTYSVKAWGNSLKGLADILTPHARLFPSHGAVSDGYFWRDPSGYIEYTLAMLKLVKPDIPKEIIVEEVK